MVASVCLVMIVLVVFSYISRTRAFKLFLSMVALVLIAALTDISFYQCASAEKYHLLANWLRCVHHAALLLIFVHYVAYICEATHYSKQRAFLLLANLLFAAALLADVIVTARG